jgi:transposase
MGSMPTSCSESSLAWLRAEPRVRSMVPTPDEADEDARRLVRERSELDKERTTLVNRIGAVLATLGVHEYDPRQRPHRARSGAGDNVDSSSATLFMLSRSLLIPPAHA